MNNTVKIKSQVVKRGNSAAFHCPAEHKKKFRIGQKVTLFVRK